MNPKTSLDSCLERAAWIAAIVGTVIAYLVLAYQIGWWPFSGTVAPPPTQTRVVTPTIMPTLIPKPTDTVRPTATLTPNSTDTPRPTAVPTLGIGSSQISPIDRATMMYVPAGEFTMGGIANQDVDRALQTCTDPFIAPYECKREWYDNANPPHKVYLDAFWMDKYEVTNARYKRCVDAGKCKPPYSTKSSMRESYYGNAQYDNYPVVFVSWGDANAYCTWARKNLPTEAQWEKAASWDDAKREKRVYPWGNTFDKNLLNSLEGGKGDTTIVGSYPGNVGPYGLLDMAGNVWEWVRDYYDANYYRNSPTRIPVNETPGQYRVMRGGSWLFNASHSIAAFRGFQNPDGRFDNLGFRCAE